MLIDAAKGRPVLWLGILIQNSGKGPPDNLRVFIVSESASWLQLRPLSPIVPEWSSVLQQVSSEKFVVANADEGDPGAYIDRFILEDDPHCLLEAMAIAAYAIGAKKGWIYLRAEYPDSCLILQRALVEAR